MQLTSLQRTNRISPVSWRCVWIGLAMLLASWPVAALSQAPFQPDPYAGPPPVDELFGEGISGRSGRAFGAQVRGGFVTGPGIGREDSFAPLEFMPYGFINNGMIFGDLRGFRSVKDGFGANVGVGYRQYLESWDRIIGANFYYDYDNTSGQLFRQSGFGLETLGSLWDMRLNAYFPVTDTRKLISVSDPLNLRYSGNNILFDQIQTFGVHMKGFDHEISVPLPGRWLERHNVKASAGYYHFQQEQVENVWGWKSRIEGDAISNVHMGLEVTHDKTFDTNVVLSVAVSYGGFRDDNMPRRSAWNRMTEPVKRQYTAVIRREPDLLAGIVATKADGTPIFVEHVASEDPYDRSSLALMRRFQPTYDPTAPLGTFENPFLTIADSQAPATTLSDITYVWTNSVFDNTPITTESGVRLLGEADNAPHLVNIEGISVLLPRAVDNTNPDPLNPFDTNTFDLKPLLTFSDRTNIVDGVTLTSRLLVPGSDPRRTEFSGFRIGDANDEDSGATGNGIFAGTGVTGVDVNYVEINHAGFGTVDGGDGIQLAGVGQMNFIGNRIFNASNNGLNVIGGAPQITFGRDPNTRLSYDVPIADSAEIAHDGSTPANGAAVRISGTGAGSLVNLAPNTNEQFFARIDYVNAIGVDIQGAEGNARFGVTNITDSPGEAIRIWDSSGRFLWLDSQSVTNDVVISNPLGDAIDIQNLAENGEVSFFGRVDISDRNQRGLDLGTGRIGSVITGNRGDISFNGGLSIATDPILTAINQPVANAIEYQDSSGDVTITNVTSTGTSLEITGGRGNGIQIGRDDGVNDLTSANNTGTFTLAGQANISNIQGISLNLLRDEATFRYTGTPSNVSQTLTISNRGDTGINIDRMRAPVSFSDNLRTVQVVVNAATNTSANPAVNIQGTQYQFFTDRGEVLPLVPVEYEETAGSVTFDILRVVGASAPARGAIAGVHVNNMQAPVAFGSLNIATTIGHALVIERTGNPFDIDLTDSQGRSPNGQVRAQGGDIAAVGSSAIRATDSNISLSFNSVSATNALTDAIFLVDNAISVPRVSPYTLEVGGQTFLQTGTGGNIVNSGGSGVYVENSGAVSLRGMSIRTNQGFGITAQNIDRTRFVNGVAVEGGSRTLLTDGTVETDPLFSEEIRIANSEILSNRGQGLLTIDMPNVNVLESRFETNGPTGTVTIGGLTFQSPNEIFLLATREMPTRTGTATPLGFADYNYTFQDVYVRENGDADAINISTSDGVIPGFPAVSGRPLLNLTLIGTDFNNTNGAEIFLQNLASSTTRVAALHVDWNGPITMTSSGYIYRSEREDSQGVWIEQTNRDEFMLLDFSGNAIILGTAGTGVQGSNSTGLEMAIDGFAGTGTANDFVVSDNYIFLNNSATGSFGMDLEFNNTAFLVLNGTVDNQNPENLIPDPNGDFGDDLIEYEDGLPGSGNLLTVNGPFGNIILMHANNTTGIELTFNAAAQATIENNVIATEPGQLEFGQEGLIINASSTLDLFGSLNNGILLDDPFNTGFQNVTGSTFPWFTYNGNLSNVTGTILINGDAVPSN